MTTENVCGSNAKELDAPPFNSLKNKVAQSQSLRDGTKESIR